MTQFSHEDDEGVKKIVSNSDVIFESDRDQDGSGDLVFRSGGVERARISAAGVGTGWGNVLGGSHPVINTAAPFGFYTVAIKTGTVLRYVGKDTHRSILFVIDETNSILIQTQDAGFTWSTSKGLPTNVPAANVFTCTRAEDGRIWLFGKNSVTGLCGVYWSAAQDGNTAFTWNGPILTLPTGSDGMVYGFAATPQTGWSKGYKFVGPHGTPTGGRVIYRADVANPNDAYSAVYGPDAADVHIHAIACDPYNDGHVYATVGDSGDRILRSTSWGDPGTWVPLTAVSGFQSVQISFDPNYVWFGSDHFGSSVIYMDRATGLIRNAATNWHRAVPPVGGAAGDTYYDFVYNGAVDPATGIFYFVTNNGGPTDRGNTRGLFYIPRPGARIELLDGITKPLATVPNVHIDSTLGFVWWGEYKTPLLSIDYVT